MNMRFALQMISSLHNSASNSPTFLNKLFYYTKMTYHQSHAVCNFCLGDETDVPPFGNINDAQDLIKPCSTCSLIAHRKCLLDWFNSLPSDKLQMIDASSLNDFESIRRTTDDTDDGVAQPPGTFIHINISSTSLQQWLTNFTRGLQPSNFEVTTREQSTHDNSNHFMTLLLVTCPQCKQDIVFSMRRSPFLALNTAARAFLTRSVQYCGLFLGFTSALTGIVSMGYVGLTSCGLRMMDTLTPEPLLVQMLSKKPNQNLTSAYNSLSQLLLGNVNSYAVDNLEQALVKGLIDPLKFSRIPLLPIVLYRMRSSSIVSCLTGIYKENSLNNWVTESMIDGYISSLGNHKLIKEVSSNVQSSVRRIIRDPSSIKQGFELFKNVDVWNINNIISLMVPLRWAYDLFFRLTINQMHYKLAMSIRPRDVSNSLTPSEVDTLEILGAELGKEELKYQAIKAATKKKFNSQFLEETSLPIITSIHKKIKWNMMLHSASAKSSFNCLKLRLSLWLQQTKACLKNDYSSTLLYKSLTIRAISTTLWPFVSSKLGQLLYKFILKDLKIFRTIPNHKVLFLSNIVGLVGIVLMKDLFNLYLSSRKAKQLSRMSIICVDGAESSPIVNEFQNDWETDEEGEQFLPGGYRNHI